MSAMFPVMVDLVSTIHVLNVADVAKAWMLGTSPSMTSREN
ncbi:hypothetical protein [Bosea sp. PAMC 26642]|nr:hypothetical protein [Bosea sp. PAMC 26642]